MGALTEIEIFDRMDTSLCKAVDHCESLAVIPLKGLTYDALRKELRLIEGCCKQAGVWRDDSRWFPIGLLMAECHKRAGDWLRGIPIPRSEGGGRIKLADGEIHPAFKMLADNLRAIRLVVVQTKNKATGRVGMILPEMQKPPTRTQGRQMGWVPPSQVSAGGIIIPDGARL